MAKKAKPNIIMSNQSLEDFIWMSYRYCIGRKTIAACMHADTIASVLASNPGLVSPERLAFNARDIRSEINSCIAFKDNIVISSYGRDNDVLSAFLYGLNEYGDPTKFTFHVDANEMKITEATPVEKPHENYKCVQNDYGDLIPWIKLANWMDESCHRKITVEFNGEVSEIICYPFPREVRHEDGRNEYVKSWARVDRPDRLSVCSWLSDEYIKKIEEL